MNDNQIAASNISSGEPGKLCIQLPEVSGYKWGWIRFALGGYTHSVIGDYGPINERTEKDYKNLTSAVENGWMPCVRSPHPALPLNKAGYVTAGDLVLCLKATFQLEGSVIGAGICEYLMQEPVENCAIEGMNGFKYEKI